MKPSFRPTTPADSDSLREFLARSYNASPDAAFLRPEVLAWKYWDPRNDWDGPRSYVLETQSEIVAHGGIWPVAIGEGSNAARGCQVIDWAASRESPGAGINIMRKIGGMLDFIQAIGGTEMTRRVLPACGFTERAHAWRGARPLRPVRQILRHQSRNWKLAPRLVRNWTWSRAPKSVLAPEWSVETIHPEALSEYARATRRPPSLFSARTPEFFEFYLRCPVGRVTLHQVRKGGAPQGHFLLLTLRGQARLAGMWLCEATPENWYATFLLAQRAAISFTDVDELVAAGTRGVSEEAAIAAGLRITGDVPVFLLGSSRRLSLPPDYQFQLCDDDEAFLDSGGPDYLT